MAGMAAVYSMPWCGSGSDPPPNAAAVPLTPALSASAAWAWAARCLDSSAYGRRGTIGSAGNEAAAVQREKGTQTQAEMRSVASRLPPTHFARLIAHDALCILAPVLLDLGLHLLDIISVYEVEDWSGGSRGAASEAASYAARHGRW